MSPELRSHLTGTLGLWVMLAVSLLLFLARPHVADGARVRARFSLLVAGAIAGQLLHFVEELGTGFHRRFPPVLGLVPWSTAFFVTFNVSWLLVWALAAVGIRAGKAVALVPLWFLGLVMLLNGAGHPLLALRAGGYFPGLVTSPVVGLLGVALLGQLATIASRRGQAD